MAFISEALRAQVEARARGRCEYCQTQQRIVIELEIDHIVPESKGGLTHLDNLCVACSGCNSFKWEYETGIDPETGNVEPLYDPRQQEWTEHFVWNDTGMLLIGLTPVGRATINRLKINRESVVGAREIWVAAGWHPPKGE